jgi:hypothetical protein
MTCLTLPRRSEGHTAAARREVRRGNRDLREGLRVLQEDRQEGQSAYAGYSSTKTDQSTVRNFLILFLDIHFLQCCLRGSTCSS